MENNVAQQIEQRLAELPEDVRAAVMSVEWEQKVHAIATKHALHIDQSGALGDVTLMAMLGFFDIADYPSRIAQELALPADKASQIATDVSSEVFTPIRASLRKFGETKTKPAPAAPAVAAPTTTPVTPPTSSGQVKPDLTAAEGMLQAKTVSTPPPSINSGQAKPANYVADPYREPPLP